MKNRSWHFGLLATLFCAATAFGQAPIEIMLCEGARVSLGQTKQQIRNTLAVCCTVVTIKDGTTEHPNYMMFSADRPENGCRGQLVFDRSERLVYASREVGEFEGSANALSLANALVDAVDRVLRRTDSVETSKVSSRSTDALILLSTTGTAKTIDIGSDNGVIRLTILGSFNSVGVELYVGDIRKGDYETGGRPKAP